MRVSKIQQIDELFHGARDVVPIDTALSQNMDFIDVRTLKKFNETAIIGTINLPLFDDGECVQIGTIS